MIWRSPLYLAGSLPPPTHPRLSLHPGTNRDDEQGGEEEKDFEQQNEASLPIFEGSRRGSRLRGESSGNFAPENCDLEVQTTPRI